MKTRGDHIRKRRLDQGLLQREVGDLIGVDKTTIYNWENGRIEPDIRYLPKIIEFLGYVPFECPDDVFGRLSYFRRIKGLTIDELGALMGRDPKQLSDWLRGKKKPFRGSLESINRFLLEHMSI
jgi:transcriptional regulator with XRE-family HTH domain